MLLSEQPCHGHYGAPPVHSGADGRTSSSRMPPHDRRRLLQRRQRDVVVLRIEQPVDLGAPGSISSAIRFLMSPFIFMACWICRPIISLATRVSRYKRWTLSPEPAALHGQPARLCFTQVYVE